MNASPSPPTVPGLDPSAPAFPVLPFPSAPLLSVAVAPPLVVLFVALSEAVVWKVWVAVCLRGTRRSFMRSVNSRPWGCRSRVQCVCVGMKL